MLAAQRKEFDEKKKDESPYPRDFARWYALDYFLRPRKLKARRFYVTLGTAVFFALLSVATLVPELHRTHQAAPVSKAHAMFNQNCANCHDRMFQPVLRWFGCAKADSVSDKKCSECHHGADHHKNQAHPAACVSCHREHQGHEVLASHVADRNRTDCHRDLSKQLGHLTDGAKLTVLPAISDFNRDHPEFQPSLLGKKDAAKIKFSHKTHLGLDLDVLRHINQETGRDDLQGLGRKLECIQCHQMDDEKKYLKPIVYENHCASCHRLNVALVGDFAPELKAAAAAFSKTPLPHKEPAVVRGVLRDRLVLFAQRNKIVAGKAEPAARPLPWKPVTDEQWSWATQQAKKTEELLFMNKQWQKTEHLTGCFHCHIEKGHADDLPVFHQTKIPSRWYSKSLFNHGSHRTMGCTECHDRNTVSVKVSDSNTAEDILLPTLKSCQECHRPSGGARNACVECHRYHDRSLERGIDGPFHLSDLVGKSK